MDLIKTTALILTVGAIQGFVISLFLIKKGLGQNKANLLLGIIMLCFSYNMFVPGVIRYYHEEFAHLCATGFPLMFLFGPGMLFYVLWVTKARNSFKTIDVLHLIPFVISLMVMIPFFGQSAAVKIATIESWRSQGLPLDVLIGWALECMHLTIYMVVCFLYVQTYSRKIRDNYSSIEEINLEWLRQLLAAKSVVWIIYTAAFVVYRFTADEISFLYTFFIFSLSTSILAYYIAYKGLIQPMIFSDQLENMNQPKYSKSGMSETMSATYLNDLLQYMETHRPYHDPNLTLRELAEQVNIPANYLSQVINEKTGQNYFDFINSYRVQEMREILSSPEQRNESILQLAYGVGFNSKSTFNAAFKKFTKTTPTSFRSLALSRALN